MSDVWTSYDFSSSLRVTSAFFQVCCPRTNGFMRTVSPSCKVGRSCPVRLQYFACLFWFNWSCSISWGFRGFLGSSKDYVVGNRVLVLLPMRPGLNCCLHLALEHSWCWARQGIGLRLIWRFSAACAWLPSQQIQLCRWLCCGEVTW